MKVNVFSVEEKFVTGEIAFVNSANAVNFYHPNGEKIMNIDKNKSIYCFSSLNDNYSNYLIKINDFIFFSPKEISNHYTFSLGDVGTGMGDFQSNIIYNQLQLLENIKSEYPNERGKVKIQETQYSYNKYGQLLKVVKDGKTIQENIYDEKSNLKRSKNMMKTSVFSYNDKNQIIKEEVEENKTKRIFFYLYNEQNRIEKTHTENQSYILEYKYNTFGQITEFIEYSSEIDKNNQQELKNTFIKKTYQYSDKNVKEESQFEYFFSRPSKFIKNKRILMTIEEQRKVAWEKFHSNMERPRSLIEKHYTYNLNKIEVEINEFSFYNNIKEKRNTNTPDRIIFNLDKKGRVINKETYDLEKEDSLVDIEKYSY